MPKQSLDVNRLLNTADFTSWIGVCHHLCLVSGWSCCFHGNPLSCI